MRWLFPLIFFVFLFELLGSQPQYRYYSSRDGLPSNQIYNLYLDKKGYLWMGHSLGLARFDGNRFANFTTPYQNSLGMSNICEDKYGTLWCHNFGGQIFYLKNNSLQVFEKYQWKTQHTFPSITLIRDEILVATHPKGLYLYNISNGKDTVIAPPGKQVQPLHFGFGKVNDVVYAIFSKQLYKLKGTTLQLMKSANFNYTNKNGSYVILGSYKDTMYMLNDDQKSISAIHISDSTYTYGRSFPAPEGAFLVTQPNEKEAWVCGRTYGVDLLNPKNRLENFNMTGIVYDAEGNTWVSTLQNGLVKKTAAPRTVKTISITNSGSEIINGIKPWNGFLAVITTRSILYFIDSSHRISLLKKEPNGKPFGVIENGPDNRLLLGSNYLYKLNNPKASIEYISSNSSIKDISYDSLGNYYVANAYSFEWVDQKGKNHPLRERRCFSVEGFPVLGKYYAAFNDGVFIFYNKKLSHELKAGNRSLFSSTLAVFEDQLAVGTVSDGVYFFRDDSLTRHLTTKNGLLSNHIIKVKYLNNRIWILTDVSLAEFNPWDGYIFHHTFGDEIGLSNISDFTMWNGHIYMSMGNQIKIYNPNGIKVIQKPKIFIDHFIINGKDTLLHQNPGLKHFQNQIRIVVSGISYSSGKALGFEYNLKGNEKVWRRVPSSNYMVDYPTLPPGNYTFRARAISAEGAQGEMILLPFSISKPWWKQWWFIVFLVLSVGCIVYFTISNRIARIRNRNALELEKVNLQSRWRDSMLATIRSQMNPHFIFNALNAIQAYIYSKDENKASNYLGKFSDLVRRILDYSQKKQITLANEIEILQLYIDLEVLRFENTLKAELYIDPDLSIDNIYIPPMLVQPYVENAIKHGLLHKQDNRELKIRFEPNADHTALLITIEDNGIGREASDSINKQKNHGHNSFSTMANQKRLEMLNMNFEAKILLNITDKMDQFNQPAGTIVLIKVPFSLNFG